MGFLIFIGVIAVIAVMIVTIYNRLVALRQTYNQAFADIEVQLKQRFDLIPNLLKTVKGYAAHEKDVLESVTSARAGVEKSMNGNDMGQRVKAENALSGAMMNLFAVAENYPDLKADANFRQFMNELSDIENKIAAARRFFNNAISEFNTAIEQFPAVLFASKFGFIKQDFFEIDESKREEMDKAPDVEF